MQTVYHIRRKGELWDWLRETVRRTNRPLAFDSVAEAEAEITWRIQHDADFATGTYEIVPHATV